MNLLDYFYFFIHCGLFYFIFVTKIFKLMKVWGCVCVCVCVANKNVKTFIYIFLHGLKRAAI